MLLIPIRFYFFNRRSSPLRRLAALCSLASEILGRNRYNCPGPTCASQMRSCRRRNALFVTASRPKSKFCRVCQQHLKAFKQNIVPSSIPCANRGLTQKYSLSEVDVGWVFPLLARWCGHRRGDIGIIWETMDEYVDPAGVEGGRGSSTQKRCCSGCSGEEVELCSPCSLLVPCHPFFAGVRGTGPSSQCWCCRGAAQASAGACLGGGWSDGRVSASGAGCCIC